LQYSYEICGEGRGYEKFRSIAGIAVSNDGYLYVTDRDLHCIVKLNLNGELISQFGGNGTTDGHFKSSSGLFLSQAELLFVCDRDNHRIQVFQSDKFFNCFGKHGLAPGFLSKPVDIAVNNSEDQLLFIAEYDNHRVQVFTPTGQFLQVFGNFIDLPFKLQNPGGIYHTPDNHLLISAYGSDCVFIFEEDGTFVSAIEDIYQGKVSHVE